MADCRRDCDFQWVRFLPNVLLNTQIWVEIPPESHQIDWWVTRLCNLARELPPG